MVLCDHQAAAMDLNDHKAAAMVHYDHKPERWSSVIIRRRRWSSVRSQGGGAGPLCDHRAAALVL